jgi:hypothetical protein
VDVAGAQLASGIEQPLDEPRRVLWVCRVERGKFSGKGCATGVQSDSPLKLQFYHETGGEGSIVSLTVAVSFRVVDIPECRDMSKTLTNFRSKALPPVWQ